MVLQNNRDQHIDKFSLFLRDFAIKLWQEIFQVLLYLLDELLLGHAPLVQLVNFAIFVQNELLILVLKEFKLGLIRLFQAFQCLIMLLHLLRELFILLLLLGQHCLQYFFLSFDVLHGHILFSFFVYALFSNLIKHLLFFLELSFQGDQDLVVLVLGYLHLFLEICDFLFETLSLLIVQGRL